MKKYMRAICIGFFVALAIILGYVLLMRVGKDAHAIGRKRTLVQQTAGDCGASQHLCDIRNKNLHDTFEERIGFTVRIGPDSHDRVERKGILVRRPHARAVVLICHGFTCSKDDVRFLRGALFSEYTTLSFDFRAHGECTSDHICTFGDAEKYDVIGAVEFIRSQPDLRNKPLIVYGFSMGAVASILAQSEKSLFDAAIWDCPFDSSDKVIERLVSKLNISIAGYEIPIPGRAFLQRHVYNPYVQDVLKRALTIRTVTGSDAALINTCMVPIDTVVAARKITIPTLIIVCKKDNKAPVEASVDIYAHLKGIRRLWITNGRGHFDSFLFSPEKYAYMVTHFIDRVLSGALKKESADGILIDKPDQAPWITLLKKSGLEKGIVGEL